MALGLPVSDLGRAATWYRRVFELGEPDLEPAPRIAEFRFGPVWLQLVKSATDRCGAQVVPSFGGADAGAERSRLAALGVAVGPLEHVEGAIDYVGLTDLDGNTLGIHSEPGGESARRARA